MKNIIITGGSGILGYNFIKYYNNTDENVLGLYNDHDIDIHNKKKINKKKIDITNKDEVDSLKQFKPDIIIHCAALANIKECESNPDKSRLINVVGTQNLVNLAKSSNCQFIYISTDAVFEGITGNYSENDIPHPKTVYGQTKLLGEKYCLDNYSNSLILRTNIFGVNYTQHKSSLSDSIIKNLSEHKAYTGFVDAFFNPIYIGNFIDITARLIDRKANGIFHITGSEKISKYEFAYRLAKTFNLNTDLVIKSNSRDYISDLNYPRNNTLSNHKVLSFLKELKIPNVSEMLSEFKQEYEKEKTKHTIQ